MSGSAVVTRGRAGAAGAGGGGGGALGGGGRRGGRRGGGTGGRFGGRRRRGRRLPGERPFRRGRGLLRTRGGRGRGVAVDAADLPLTTDDVRQRAGDLARVVLVGQAAGQRFGLVGEGEGVPLDGRDRGLREHRLEAPAAGE